MRYKIAIAYLICACSLLALPIVAQTNISGTVNTYAPVTDISFNTGSSITNCNSAKITVGARSGATANFAVNDRVLIIQMQGAVPITANGATFGTVSTVSSASNPVASAGNFEFSTISAVTASGANQIVTLSTALKNTYDKNGLVQLIRVPVYASGANVTANVTGLSWDGSVGGVISFVSQGTLTLSANITADGIGFRGGAAVNTNSTCNTNYSFAASTNSTAEKGEGIVIDNANFGWGKGAWANGGGGAHRETGGGGGAGAGAGGTGRRGRVGGTDCNNAGIGGYAQTYSNTKVFMGGGGGGGHSGSGSPSAGATGGGIILIDATAIVSSVLPRTITANGNAASNTAVRDGAGGGGGGGAIYISNSGSYTRSVVTAILTVSAQGGAGGTTANASNNDCSGSGGGGGGGIVRTNTVSGTAPTISVIAGVAGTARNNCDGGGDGTAGSTNATLTLTTSPTCTATISGIASLCTGSLGTNAYSAGDFGVITGTSELLATNADWISPSAVTFKTNTAPWNALAPGYTYSFNATDAPNDGAFTIVTGVRDIYSGTWIVSNDNSGGATGFMMIVNCSYAPDKFYEQTITGLCELSKYEFSVDLLNLDQTSFRTVTNTGGSAGYGPICDTSTDPTCMQKIFSSTFSGVGGTGSRVCPDIEFLIDDAVVVASNPIPNNATWTKYGVTFITGTGVTSVKLSMRNKAPGGGGNDLGVDNIAFRPCGPAVSITQPSIACNQVIYEAVVGGEYTTPVYQWQYSTDGGSNWSNIPGATGNTYTLASPVSIGNELRFLTAQSNTNLASASCRVVSTNETADCTLPVTLANFAVEKEGESAARLSWVSLSESNTHYFAIERSNGIGAFDSVGVIMARGDSDDRVLYTFLDPTVESGTYYYRLRMVDFNETFTYSPVRHVSFTEIEGPCRVTAYATSEGIFVKAEQKLPDGEFVVINMLGQMMASGQFKGKTTVINNQNWPPGIYLLKYDCIDGSQTIKVQVP